jgi:hypothetical protein
MTTTRHRLLRATALLAAVPLLLAGSIIAPIVAVVRK